jgi:hypothetical protein
MLKVTAPIDSDGRKMRRQGHIALPVVDVTAHGFGWIGDLRSSRV